MLPSLLLAVLLVAWGPGGALAQPALQPAAAGSELPRALLDGEREQQCAGNTGRRQRLGGAQRRRRHQAAPPPPPR